jgi:hypothetical protein
MSTLQYNVMFIENSGLISCCFVCYANSFRSFEGSWCLPLFNFTVQKRCLTPKKRLLRSVEWCGNTCPKTHPHIPEDLRLHQRRCENLDSSTSIDHKSWHNVFPHLHQCSSWPLNSTSVVRGTLPLPFAAACRGRQHFHCFHTVYRTSICCLLAFTGFMYCVILCLS